MAYISVGIEGDNPDGAASRLSRYAQRQTMFGDNISGDANRVLQGISGSAYLPALQATWATWDAARRAAVFTYALKLAAQTGSDKSMFNSVLKVIAPYYTISGAEADALYLANAPPYAVQNSIRIGALPPPPVGVHPDTSFSTSAGQAQATAVVPDANDVRLLAAPTAATTTTTTSKPAMPVTMTSSTEYLTPTPAAQLFGPVVSPALAAPRIVIQTGAPAPKSSTSTTKVVDEWVPDFSALNIGSRLEAYLTPTYLAIAAAVGLGAYFLLKKRKKR